MRTATRRGGPREPGVPLRAGIAGPDPAGGRAPADRRLVVAEQRQGSRRRTATVGCGWRPVQPTVAMQLRPSERRSPTCRRTRPMQDLLRREVADGSSAGTRSTSGRHAGPQCSGRRHPRRPVRRSSDVRPAGRRGGWSRRGGPALLVGAAPRATARTPAGTGRGGPTAHASHLGAGGRRRSAGRAGRCLLVLPDGAAGARIVRLPTPRTATTAHRPWPSTGTAPRSTDWPQLRSVARRHMHRDRGHRPVRRRSIPSEAIVPPSSRRSGHAGRGRPTTGPAHQMAVAGRCEPSPEPRAGRAQWPAGQRAEDDLDGRSGDITVISCRRPTRRGQPDDGRGRERGQPTKPRHRTARRMPRVARARWTSGETRRRRRRASADERSGRSAKAIDGDDRHGTGPDRQTLQEAEQPERRPRAVADRRLPTRRAAAVGRDRCRVRQRNHRGDATRLDRRALRLRLRSQAPAPARWT